MSVDQLGRPFFCKTSASNLARDFLPHPRQQHRCNPVFWGNLLKFYQRVVPTLESKSTVRVFILFNIFDKIWECCILFAFIVNIITPKFCYRLIFLIWLWRFPFFSNQATQKTKIFFLWSQIIKSDERRIQFWNVGNQCSPFMVLHIGCYIVIWKMRFNSAREQGRVREQSGAKEQHNICLSLLTRILTRIVSYLSNLNILQVLHWYRSCWHGWTNSVVQLVYNHRCGDHIQLELSCL